MTTLSLPRRRPDERAPGSNQQDNSKAAGNPTQDSNKPVAATQVLSKQDQSKAGRKPRAIYYPTGDGKPVAEDMLHLDLMNYAIPALRYRFRSRPEVYVAGNNFLYYEEGNPKARVSPDCYVAFGVAVKGHRRFYKVWEENDIAPAVIFEFTSKKTKKEDVTIKKPLYEQVLGVQEYFQFDPSGDYLHPRLQGQRLHAGQYQPIALNDNRMFSEKLGLELVIEGETLRFYDPVQGVWLNTYDQAETQRMASEQRAETAEAELNRLRLELEALRQQK